VRPPGKPGTDIAGQIRKADGFSEGRLAAVARQVQGHDFPVGEPA